MGRAKHTSDNERVLIFQMWKNGSTMNKIAKQLNVSRKRVQNAIKKAKQTKPTPENRGRPRKTSARLDREITLKVKKDPFLSAPRLKEMVSSQYNIKLSASTIKRRLCDAKLNGRIAKKKPHVSKRNIEKRLTFAKSHRDRDDKWWRNVLWSDESKFNRFSSDGKVYVRRPPNQENNPKYTLKTVKHGGGNVIVWGCFSWYGVGPLFRINGIMNAEMYKHILKDVMLPYARSDMPLIWKFMHDNDPKHTAKIIKKFIEKEKISILEWPPQSPDLNPIENLWNTIDKRIDRSKATNLDNFWEEIQKAWYSISEAECRCLVSSMGRRCEAVLKNKGFPTKY